MTDHSQEMPYEEITAWFLARVKELGVRGFGREYKLNPGRISRNRTRILKKKPMSGSFTKLIAGIMAAERADELHRQHLAEQAAEVQRQGEAVGGILFAVRSASQQREAAARIEADRKRRQWDLEEAFIRSIKIWEEKFRAAGYMVGEQMVSGDADELLLAGISDLNYIDIGAAAVALLPDNYVIWRDKTVAFFREGVPYTRRLQPSAVPEGQPRPAMIGNVPASTVYYDPLPIELWLYGKKGARTAAKWRELMDAYGHLATGPLPRVVHPETVSGFERLILIEEQSGYTFEDSRLGPDARDRLKALQRRAILPAISITTKDIIFGSSKSAAGWFCSNGWKWSAGTILILLAAAGIVWGAIELSKLIWAGFTWVGNWSKHNWRILVLAAELLLIGGGVTWWVWPKERDTGWMVTVRICCVVLGLVMVGAAVVGLFFIGKAIHEIGVALQPLRQGIYIP